MRGRAISEEPAPISARPAQRGMDAAEPGATWCFAPIALNRRSDALAALRRTTYKTAFKGSVGLALDPRLDPVRSDSRFRKYFKPA